MSTIGRFEILGEISTSTNGCVYKANDPESKQVVALKTLRLETLGDRASELLQQFFDEADGTKALNSPNIALLYGAGDIDGQFCGAMEYVQGKSIADMLRQGDGFSIWDLQDIARQACQGLDHAHAHKIVHYSLEPDKVVVQWDGTVKILGFGVSILSLYSALGSGTSCLLHYMSPEQVRGEVPDARSNLFSLGAILYEMATGRRPFNGENDEAVKQQILEATPAPPHELNKKIHAAVSDVILKALAKNPDERYQSGQEMVQDLERHRHSTGKSAAGAKSTSTSATVPANGEQRDTQPAAAPAQAAKPARRARAAAASGAGQSTSSSENSTADPTEQFINSCIKASMETISPSAEMSAAAVAPKPEAPNFVDPLMAEGSATADRSKSFSEIDQLPPLKEVYVAPPASVAEAPDPLQELREPHFQADRTTPATAPSKQLAKKAVQEIGKTPPKLFLYSLGAAAAIIALVVGFIASRVSSQNGEDNGSAPSSAVETAHGIVAPVNSTQANASKTPSTGPLPGPAEAKQTFISVKPKITPKKAARAVAPVAVLVPGQLIVNSTPEGATVMVDGQGDSAWITPYEITGLTPGPHSVTLSKAGFTPETRSIEVASKSKSFLVIQLAPLPATLLVAADPPGAQIILDGKDTGRVTPSQLRVDNPGNHSLLVKKQGFLEESTTVNLQSGQSFRFAPKLRQLGSTDDIKTAGKIKKLFGGGPDGMGAVTVKTQPKNAQVAVNRRILDKNSPVQFYLNPGTYVVDITLTGYKNIQRVINVEKDGKVAIDESLERQ